MSGRRPKRRVHIASLRTMSRGPPARVSSSVNVRPMAGGIPKTLKNAGDTRAPGTRSGYSPAVTVAPAVLYNPSDSNAGKIGRASGRERVGEGGGGEEREKGNA